MLVTILISIFTIIVFGKIFTPKPGDKRPVRNAKVTVASEHFTAAAGNEKVSVRWEDVHKVTAIATDRGPWKDEVFYHIIHNGGDLTLPSNAKGADELISRIMTLPGFDADAFERARDLTQKDTFVVILRNEEVPA